MTGGAVATAVATMTDAATIVEVEVAATAVALGGDSSHITRVAYQHECITHHSRGDSWLQLR